MLVLRRRPNEAIVFEGGLFCTLAGIADGLAWLTLAREGDAGPVELGIAASSGADKLRIAIRAVGALERAEHTTTVSLVSAPADPDTFLVLDRAAGEGVGVGSLTLKVESFGAEGLGLRLEAPGLAAAVVLRIVSLSGVEARIGVDAPEEIRVFRREVWDELHAANTEAAATWSANDLAALAKEPPK